MIEILKKDDKNSADVVSQQEVKIGDEFMIGRTVDGKPIMGKIDVIHEQRKERGVYVDESNRRMWAKVSYQQYTQNN